MRLAWEITLFGSLFLGISCSSATSIETAASTQEVDSGPRWGQLFPNHTQIKQQHLWLLEWMLDEILQSIPPSQRDQPIPTDPDSEPGLCPVSWNELANQARVRFSDPTFNLGLRRATNNHLELSTGIHAFYDHGQTYALWLGTHFVDLAFASPEYAQGVLVRALKNMWDIRCISSEQRQWFQTGLLEYRAQAAEAAYYRFLFEDSQAPNIHIEQTLEYWQSSNANLPSFMAEMSGKDLEVYAQFDAMRYALKNEGLIGIENTVNTPTQNLWNYKLEQISQLESQLKLIKTSSSTKRLPNQLAREVYTTFLSTKDCISTIFHTAPYRKALEYWTEQTALEQPFKKWVAPAFEWMQAFSKLVAAYPEFIEYVVQPSPQISHTIKIDGFAKWLAENEVPQSKIHNTIFDLADGNLTFRSDEKLPQGWESIHVSLDGQDRDGMDTSINTKNVRNWRGRIENLMPVFFIAPHQALSHQGIDLRRIPLASMATTKELHFWASSTIAREELKKQRSQSTANYYLIRVFIPTAELTNFNTTIDQESEYTMDQNQDVSITVAASSPPSVLIRVNTLGKNFQGLSKVLLEQYTEIITLPHEPRLRTHTYQRVDALKNDLILTCRASATFDLSSCKNSIESGKTVLDQFSTTHSQYPATYSSEDYEINAGANLFNTPEITSIELEILAEKPSPKAASEEDLSHCEEARIDGQSKQSWDDSLEELSRLIQQHCDY